MQGNIIQLCQTKTSDPSSACGGSDNTVIYREDLAYANDVMTTGTSANLACQNIQGGETYNNLQYHNNQLAYVKKSGEGFYDPDYQLATSEECYHYDGVGRLIQVARQVVDSSNNYQTYRREHFTYDANGNMTQKDIFDYHNNCQKTDSFNSSATNNQLENITYGGWTAISTNSACQLAD